MNGKTSRLLCFAVAFLLIINCGCGKKTKKIYSSPTGKYREEGIASWYGKKFHGRQTANGEKYDMYGMTAAHKTLPFNTIVEVLNLDNGKKTVVRINDRGPFVKGRIIDLTKSAAKELDMIASGTARVRLRVLSNSTKIKVTTKQCKTNLESYTVQAGSFSSSDNAQRFANSLATVFGDVHIKGYDGLFRVYVGKTMTKTEAQAMLNKLRLNGHDGFITREDK